MKENSEILAQQIKSVGIQSRPEPEIILVTPGARSDDAPCLPICPPSCQPVIFPGPCAPDFRLPRPPIPPGPNLR